MRSMVWALAGLVWAGAAEAQTSPADLLAGTAGAWAGALGYRDYQSNRLFELPVETDIVLAADGRTLIRTSRFDEGAAPAVFIVSAAAFDAESGLYETAGFRAGRAMYVSRERVSVQAAADASHWTLIFAERGMDDDRAADIRITLTRNGDEMLSVKEVDYLDDPDVRFEFRNQTRLTRVR